MAIPGEQVGVSCIWLQRGYDAGTPPGPHPKGILMDVPVAHVGDNPPIPIVGLSGEATDYLLPLPTHAEMEARALAEFATLLATTLETVEDNPDLPAWIEATTETWTVRHARQALILAGMLCQATGTTPEMVADVAKTLLDR
jgi:hypothetical protein